MPIVPPLLTADAQAAPVSTRAVRPARPFLKWVGGKRRVVQHIEEHLLPLRGCFHEPFVGGGAVFFALNGRPGLLPAGARLSDFNLRLVRTWCAVRDQLDQVVAHLEEHRERHDEKHYYEVRARSIDDADDAELAAWFIYLNKTGYNGLYRVNSRGGFNVPMGSYKKPRILDEENLRAVSACLQGIDIVHQDFEAALAAAVPGDVVYLDPPYVPLSKTSSFTGYTAKGFGHQDQERLAQAATELVQRGVRVVLSNHDTADLRALYPTPPFGFKTIRVRRSVNRDGGKRGGVAEVVIYGG